MTTRLPVVALSLLLSLPLAAQSAAELRDQGIAAFEHGQTSEAIGLFQQLTKLAPSGENFSYLATAELRGDRLQPAIADFEHALHLGYGPGSVHYNLGMAYLQAHQAADGIRHLRQAVALEPHSQPMRYTLGVALLEAGQPVQALPYLDPRDEAHADATQWANYIRAQLEAHQEKAALASIDAVTGLRPDDLPLAVTLARLCLQNGQAQKARYLLENASELAPQDPEIPLLLAQASVAAGEAVEALAVLKNIPPASGRPGEWHALRGQALAMSGKFPEALSELAAARSADPANLDYLLSEARIEQEAGKYPESITLLNQARLSYPKTAAIPYRIAVAEFLLKRYELAEKECANALRLSPDDHPAWFLMGIARLDAHDFSGARTNLERAVALDGGSSLYRTELGIATLKTGDAADAREQLNLALKLAPKSPNAYYWRAMALDQLHEPRQAIADLETAVAIEPDYANAFYELARLYRATGQDGKAKAALARNQALKSQHLNQDQQRLLKQLPQD